jgi:hypothetical protein
MGKKETVTTRIWEGMKPFTAEQWVVKRKKEKAARKQRKVTRQHFHR